MVMDPTRALGQARDVVDPAANRLAGAIRFKTISYEDKQKIDFGPFLELRGYLEQYYPRVHAALDREVIGECNLLYCWKGKDSTRKPVLLAGHQDVVPVEGETGEAWKYPPFDGCIEEGFIWGRGTLDNKFAVTGILKAVEGLLEQGFQPERTIYLGFGQDEEIGGWCGAALIMQALRERNVSLDFVLDEGLAIAEGVIPNLDRPVGLIGIAEKGFLSVELTVECEGGHSSMPGRESAIGILAAAIARLEKHPLPPRGDSPVFQMFDAIGDNMPLAIRLALNSRQVTGPLLYRILARIPSMNAMIRTTTAATMFHSGVKENILPAKARAVVNFRILPGDSVASVMEAAKKIVHDPRVKISPAGNVRSEPSPVSRVEGDGYRLISRAIQAIFPEVLVAPGLVAGATDSRHYAPISQDVYRFSPIRVGKEDLKRIHGANERISVAHYAKVVAFYREIIQNI